MPDVKRINALNFSNGKMNIACSVKPLVKFNKIHILVVSSTVL